MTWTHRKLNTILLPVLLCLLMVGFCTTDNLNRANELMTAGDFLGARRIYENVLSRSPQNFAAHYGVGMTHCAEALYRTELGLAGPADWYRAIYHMSIASNMQNNEKVNKTLAILHFNLGACYRKTGETKAAILRLEQAIVYDSTLTKAHNLLGAMYHAQGDLSQAYQHYMRTIEIRPDYGMAHFNLGAVEWARGNYKAAGQHFANAVEHAPDNTLFQHWLTTAKTKTGSDPARMD